MAKIRSPVTKRYIQMVLQSEVSTKRFILGIDDGST